MQLLVLTSSKVTITNDTSTNIYLPLIFASSSTAGTQPLNFDNDANGPAYNPSLKSILAQSFSGSLLGTATQAVNSTLATSATTSLSASTVTIANVIPYFLTFVNSNNTPAASEQLFTNPSLTATSGLLYVPTLSSSIISASSINASAGLTGSLLGTSSDTVTSSYIRTTASSATTYQFLTFVNSNNFGMAPPNEQLSTNALAYKPSNNSFYLAGDPQGTIVANSFTGSLIGVASYAVSSSRTYASNISDITTVWTSSATSLIPPQYFVPEGRDVGVIWNNEDGDGQSIYLNTSSAQLGDQVRITTTKPNLPPQNRGRISIFVNSGSATPNTRVIVAGLTPNPSTHQQITQTTDGSTFNQNYSYFYLICVSSSAGATNNTTWQLADFSSKGFSGYTNWVNWLTTN
jgi:hypothetical protein